jgi:hypothetical protein
MKIILMITGISIVLFFYQADSTEHSGKIGNKISPGNDPVDYKTQVMPLLQKTCSPCHFEGGKMYAKMPFDTSVTILRHEAGILKRIDNKPEGALIKQFILQSKQ